MTAAEARELSAQANDPNTGPIGFLTRRAYGLIKSATEEGCRTIIDPFIGVQNSITHQQRELAYKHLESQGYTVKHNTDQREGKSWVAISW